MSFKIDEFRWMMVGGETSLVTLITVILCLVSQINRKSLYVCFVQLRHIRRSFFGSIHSQDYRVRNYFIFADVMEVYHDET